MDFTQHPLASDLTGKTAIITAGANGIGAGAAMALARMGANIVIGDIDEAAAQKRVETIVALGGRAEAVTVNLLDPGEGRTLVETAKSLFGRIDFLVNNAGGVRMRPFLDQSASSWQRVIDLNFTSMLATSQETARIMEDSGAIVNVASTEAFRAAPGFGVYAAMKAAMVEFTKTLALELSPRQIRVNAIAPDLVDTPGLTPHLPTDQASVNIRNRNVPLGRMASIDEAGAAIAFLASPAASWITGITIPVDGGITAAAGWHRDPSGKWQIAS